MNEILFPSIQRNYIEVGCGAKKNFMGVPFSTFSS
jgi:hypothetical protein